MLLLLISKPSPFIRRQGNYPHSDFAIGASAAEIIAPQVLISIRHIIWPPIGSIISKHGIPPGLVKTARARDELVCVGRIVEIAVGGAAVEVAKVCDHRVVNGVVIQVPTDVGAVAALILEIGYRASQSPWSNS